MVSRLGKIAPVMLKRSVTVGIIFFLIFTFLRHAGSILVQNDPRQAEVLVVLAGGDNDSRYWHAVELLKRGYGNAIVLDVLAARLTYGRPDTELAAEFISRTAPGHATVCPVMADSTFDETRGVARCLEPLHAHSILLVTSDFHTRRALSVFRHKLPDYQWTVAAADDPLQFGTKWWTRREWAKTTLLEWQRLLWWNLVDRWR